MCIRCKVERYGEVAFANPGDELVMAAFEDALTFPEGLDAAYSALPKRRRWLIQA